MKFSDHIDFRLGVILVLDGTSFPIIFWH